MTPARSLLRCPSTIALLACASLAISAPAAAHGAEATTASHAWGWVGRAVDYVASCLPGRNSASHGSSWWSSDSGETAEHGTGGEKNTWSALTRSATGARDADDNYGRGAIGSDSAGSDSVGSGAAGSGENGGFGGSLGTDDAGTGASGNGAVENGPGTAPASSTDVPEPGMLGLIAAALIPLALRRRARRKGAAAG